jgi:hypothetical protein
MFGLDKIFGGKPPVDSDEVVGDVDQDLSSDPMVKPEDIAKNCGGCGKNYYPSEGGDSKNCPDCIQEGSEG